MGCVDSIACSTPKRTDPADTERRTPAPPSMSLALKPFSPKDRAAWWIVAMWIKYSNKLALAPSETGASPVGSTLETTLARGLF